MLYKFLDDSHGASVQHAARVALLRMVGVVSDPLVLQWAVGRAEGRLCFQAAAQRLCVVRLDGFGCELMRLYSAQSRKQRNHKLEKATNKTMEKGNAFRRVTECHNLQRRYISMTTIARN